MNPNTEVKTLFSENFKKTERFSRYIHRKKESCEDNHATKSSL